MHVSEMCHLARGFGLMAIFAIRCASAAEIVDWSATDGSNSATPPAGWPEGMNPAQVNDTGRAMMGAIKRWYNAAPAPNANGVSPETLKVAGDSDDTNSLQAALNTCKNVQLSSFHTYVISH